tara:strand:+ start:99 stop:701 length:603 start_codon:yes stop_codon:yes gene_type:complete
MATEEELSQLRQDLTDRANSLEQTLETYNNDLESSMLELRQVLQMNYPHHTNEEDNLDILVDGHLRDITAEQRPQMSSAGLETNNKHFRDLSNHELHQIKKLHEKDHKQEPRTVLDESLGEIMNKCINFLTYSFDGYTKAYYQAEIMEDIYDDEKTMYESIKVHLIALTLFFRDDGNILYIGILLVFLSIIIYLVNITTS